MPLNTLHSKKKLIIHIFFYSILCIVEVSLLFYEISVFLVENFKDVTFLEVVAESVTKCDSVVGLVLTCCDVTSKTRK